MLLCVGLLCATQALFAGEKASPKQWLEKMSAAMQELSYQGVFIYRRDEDLAAMKVTHIVDEHGARELLETLTGEARREMRAAPVAGDSGAAPQLGRIHHYYDLELMGDDRAAGRDTRLVSVIPKDEYRYGYRLWLDQATGLLLKSDLLAQDGSILEQVMFTSLKLLEPDEVGTVSPPANSHSAKHPATKAQSPQASQWDVAKLPQGFELLESRPVSKHGNVEHMVYSDGLASVSVFVEPAKAAGEAFVGLSRMGAVNAYGRVDGDFQVTVVGEVPEVTVTTIGRSISRKGDTQ